MRNLWQRVMDVMRRQVEVDVIHGEIVPPKRVAICLTFYDDGSTQIETETGYLLTATQATMLNKFCKDQMLIGKRMLTRLVPISSVTDGIN